MIQNIPEYADLGTTVSAQTRHTWEAEIGRRNQYWHYFDGAVFQETVPVDHGADEDAPLLYPVGLNLVKMLCVAQADSMFGEWEDQIVKFAVAEDKQMLAAEERAIQLLALILRTSKADSMLWEVDLDRQIGGGGAFKIVSDKARPGHVKWTRVPLQSFFPIWDPEDPDELLEVFIVVPMTPDQARARYGYTSSKDLILRVEHWTKSKYETLLDGQRISAYSGVNPWGLVPFVYIPRFRTATYWGHALTEDIIPVQDELNMRLGDLGEAINYNAHPIRWGLNMPQSFNAENYPIGSNTLWDLGRVIGSSPRPEVGALEIKNPVPEGAFRMVDFLYDWSRTSAQSPPIAFGEDDGGGQRSGVTLEIRMWPLIKATKRSRAYMGGGLARAASITARILQQKQYSDIPVRALEAIIGETLVPQFARIMPRDQAAIVDEVVKLLSTPVPAISLETAVKLLGRGPGEVERIREMLKDGDFKDLLAKPQPFSDPSGFSDPQPQEINANG